MNDVVRRTLEQIKTRVIAVQANDDEIMVSSPCLDCGNEHTRLIPLDCLYTIDDLIDCCSDCLYARGILSTFNAFSFDDDSFDN